MKLSELLSISSLVYVASGGVANAVIIGVGSAQYDVTSVRATDLGAGLLESQPWWGDSNAAASAALAVADSIGVPDLTFPNFIYGPAFAYAESVGTYSTTFPSFVYSPRAVAVGAAPVWGVDEPRESGDVFFAVATKVRGAGVPEGGPTSGMFALGLGCLLLLCRTSVRPEGMKAA